MRNILLFIPLFFILINCGSNDIGDFDIPPSIKDINITLTKIDKATNIGEVHIACNIELEVNAALYSNGKITTFTSGTVEDGVIQLPSGKHLVQICATNEFGTTCTPELRVLISKNLPLSDYKRFPLESPAYSLSNDGHSLIYGTQEGQIYSLDLATELSTFIYNVQRHINGLVYVNSNESYYSSTTSQSIYNLNIAAGTEKSILSLKFPDGLDLYQNKLYSVTDDASGIISVFSVTGGGISTINTKISDVVGISHTDSYLYILSEDGEIFQTNHLTGVSSKLFTNDNLFEKGNNANGLEGISILNNKIYVSYINDLSVYLIDIDLKKYE